MSACRSLTQAEVLQCFNALLCKRDQALFVLGVLSGFRISEMLSLKVKDVMRHNVIVDQVTVASMYMKGKESSRTVVLHSEAKASLIALIQSRESEPGSYLFRSNKSYNKPITRIQAWRLLKAAFSKAGITGSVATHSMRKTFAVRVHKDLQFDIFKTQQALGHKNIVSTIRYMAFFQEEINAAILNAKVGLYG